MPYLRQLPSKKWQATYRDSLGRRHSITRATKPAARDAALEEESKLRRGAWIDPDRSSVTFADWRITWERSAVLEESTRRKYKSVLDNHVMPTWRNARIDAIRKIDVQTWVSDLERKKVGRVAIATAHQALAVVLQAAVDDERLIRNPARGVTLPTVGKQPDRYIEDAELERIVAQILVKRDPRMRHQVRDERMVRVMRRLGLRWGEVSGLHTHRVNLDRRELYVVEVATKHAGIKEYPKSENSHRTLPLTNELARMLAEQVATVPAGGLVFPDAEGGLIDGDNWRTRVWTHAVKRAKIPAPLPTPHDLRHTCASALVADGMDIYSLQLFMGHESIRTTQKYLHAGADVTARMRAVLAKSDAPVTHEVVDLDSRRPS